MTTMVCDYYRMKVDRLPTNLQYAGLYVRAGEKPPGIRFDDYELTGRTYQPDRHVIAEIERGGICRRELRANTNPTASYPDLPG